VPLGVIVSHQPAVDPVHALLTRPVGACWSLSFYPDAREAGGAFLPSRPYARGGGVRGQARDPGRARVEAARRAKGKLRRYCAANRLNRLGTLTYRGTGCHDQRQVRAHVGEFFRNLRVELNGDPIPYAWVPEWHKTDHGLHLHFAVGRFIKRALIEASWPHGFVHIKVIGDLPVGSGTLGEARKAAGYLSKYVAKSFADTNRIEGLHRYDLAQGFQPRVQRITGRSPDAVIGEASDLVGTAPIRRWSSADVPEWQGGPAIWAQWA
jgi:hypothetical protein